MVELTPLRQKEIEEAVSRIVRVTGVLYPEESLLSIPSALGIKVLENDIDPNILGYIQYRNDKEEIDPVIVVNKSFQPERKTFTLAHEIGHFVLHQGTKKYRLDKIIYPQDEKTATEELEADYFATALLVPLDRLKKLLLITGGANLNFIAKYFGVPLPVVNDRIKWMMINR